MTTENYRCVPLFERMKGLFSPLKKTEDRYHNFDFYSGDGKIWVEVKGRNVLSTQYATTVVGHCKTKYADKYILPKYEEAEVYFIFEFKDRCLYIKYDPVSWVRYEVADMYGKPHWFIPTAECSVLE